MHLAVEDDGQAFADIFSGDTLENARALAVKINGHVVAALILIETHAGVGQVSPGEHGAFLDQKRLLDLALGGRVAGHLVEDFGPRRGALLERRACRQAFIHQLEFKLRRAPDKLLGPFGVLDARQLDQQAFVALAPDIRFGDPELVDAVTDRLQGLGHGQFPDAFGLLIGQIEDQGETLAVAHAVLDPQVAEFIVQEGFEGLDIVRLLNSHLNTVVVDFLKRRAAHLVPPGTIFQFLGRSLDGAFNGLIGIDFQNEMHAPLKIEPQVDLFLEWKGGHEGRQDIDDGRQKDRDNEDGLP